MSINVTVTGNPVRIKKGTMVTAACDSSRTEFEKRRLMRLEQVRHQSKDIAQSVRNKIRNAKSDQLSRIEKEGEIKLKNWQARKLLELQNQYQEALSDIGLGHKQAEDVERQDEILMEQKKREEEIAKERGREATEQLQVLKNEQNLRKAMPVQRKKLSRDSENVRANYVAKSGKFKAKSPGNKKKKTQSSSLNSDGENQMPQMVLDDDSDVHLAENEMTSPGKSTRKGSREQQSTTKESRQVQTMINKAAQTCPEAMVVNDTIPLSVRDTRISERIKRRSLLNPELDYCDVAVNDLVATPPVVLQNEECNCCQCPVELGQKINADIENLQDDKTSHMVASAKKPPNSQLKSRTVEKPAEIPTKPRVTLKSVKQPRETVTIPTLPAAEFGNKVQHYDHPNRFSKLTTSTSRVEKINDDDFVISPTVLSDGGYEEKMRQRDFEAHIRGQKAMEKEKIHREYRELLKKLPALQKQERICDISGDKPAYHMSDARLKELEQKRQNVLDNAYENLFERRPPAVVTLPKRSNVAGQLSRDAATWDVDFGPLSRNRTEQLNELLEGLRAQKDELLREIENLPENDGSKAQKRKRDDVTSPTPSDGGVETKSSSIGTKSGTTTGGVPSPRKKAKYRSRRRVLILQNTSTQTTPRQEPSPPVECPKKHVPCDCVNETNDLCEILIKVNDEAPQITVNPSEKGKKFTVVNQYDSNKVVSSKVKLPKAPPVVDKNLTKASWREQLSQNSSRSTSSTTYLSPPDFLKLGVLSKEAPKKISGSINKTASSDGSKVSDSTANSSKALDPRLLVYIKKLLNMSRANIDNLAVSSDSGVSTPNQSVIEMSSNNPLTQLRNVMKYFNLDTVDVKKQLSYLSDDSNIHYNTSQSIGLSSRHSSTKSKSRGESDLSEKSEPVRKQLSQYADIAESCNKKISDLTAMIEKVRAEKKKMLQTSPAADSGSEDFSTAYMNLPQPVTSQSSSSSSSINQDELDRKLLEIDYSYAERLKMLTPEELQQEKERREQEGNSDQELLSRLKRLLEDSKVAEESQKNTDYVPLLDIRKLPKLDAAISTEGNKKRPPPSKGLRIVQKFNGNMLGVPHELSTIVEADSQLSTKLDPSPKSSVSPKKSSNSSSSSVPDILTEISQNQPKSGSQTNSSDDKSEMEAMETMLHSIGMEWAIPTLRKTREALALSSSSSDDKSRRDRSSDVSLAEFLSRHLSSTLKSNENSGRNLEEFDNRRTSTPVQLADMDERGKHVGFTGVSDLSSVREQSGGSGGHDYDKENSGGSRGGQDQFYELNTDSLSKTG